MDPLSAFLADWEDPCRDWQDVFLAEINRWDGAENLLTVSTDSLMITPPTDTYAWPSIAMSPAKLDTLTYSLMHAGVGYGLGAKADPLSLQAGQFDEIDCSGFVRWAIYHATGQTLEIPDGSVTQHEWVEARGFKPSEVADGLLQDGAVRIAFLSPQDGGGIGHVMLVSGGTTMESHGHHGPDFRDWESHPFMARCELYVLTPPPVQTS